MGVELICGYCGIDAGGRHKLHCPTIMLGRVSLTEKPPAHPPMSLQDIIDRLTQLEKDIAELKRKRNKDAG